MVGVRSPTNDSENPNGPSSMMARIFRPARPGNSECSGDLINSRMIRSEPSLPKSSPLSATNATGCLICSGVSCAYIFFMDVAAAIRATRPVMRELTAGVASLKKPAASMRAATTIRLLSRCAFGSLRDGSVATTLCPPIGRHVPAFKHETEFGGLMVGCFPKPAMRSSVCTCHNLDSDAPFDSISAFSAARALAKSVLGRSNNIIGTPLKSIPVASTPPTKPPVTFSRCAGPGAYPLAHPLSSSVSTDTDSTNTPLIFDRNAFASAESLANARRIKFCHAAGVASNTLSSAGAIVSSDPSGGNRRSGAEVTPSFEHPTTPSLDRRVTQNAPRSGGLRNARRSAQRRKLVTLSPQFSSASAGDAHAHATRNTASATRAIARLVILAELSRRRAARAFLTRPRAPGLGVAFNRARASGRVCVSRVRHPSRRSRR